MVSEPESDALQSAWLDILQEQVRSLRFGFVQIVVHDGHVVRIERTEKFRVASEQRNDVAGS